MKTLLIEICATSAESAIAAELGGANRIELCENLMEGGTTPSIGMIEVCASKVKIPIHVLIRPRPGDFVYSDLDVEIMIRDIQRMKEIDGVKGFVIGALKPNGEIDIDTCKRLLEVCFPLQVTFHRAFDVCAHPEKALEQIIEMGFHVLLSSGQESSALKGIELLKNLSNQAANRITIMPGAGINETNIAELKPYFNSFHMSLRSLKESPMLYRKSNLKMSSISRDDDCAYFICDKNKVKLVREILNHD
jgi:copper homeostasis protein